VGKTIFQSGSPCERIEKILPRLGEMVDGGLITLEKVRVILCRAAKKWRPSSGLLSGARLK
jgi:hypothetical protein